MDTQINGMPQIMPIDQQPADYVWLQTKKYLSHEEDVDRWRDGQTRFIDQFLIPAIESLGKNIELLDAGCGDGTGLGYLKKLGYSSLTGTDLSVDKIQRAVGTGALVIQSDLHELKLKDAQFDVVYSSHTLEHCYSPDKAINELKRVAKSGAKFIIVLPYVDVGPLDAHCGSPVLGTRGFDDKAARLISWLNTHGLTVDKVAFDNYREPEVWLALHKD